MKESRTRSLETLALLARDPPLLAMLTRGRTGRSPRQWHTVLLLVMAFATLKKKEQVRESGKERRRITHQSPAWRLDRCK